MLNEFQFLISESLSHEMEAKHQDTDLVSSGIERAGVMGLMNPQKNQALVLSIKETSAKDRKGSSPVFNLRIITEQRAQKLEKPPRSGVTSQISKTKVENAKSKMSSKSSKPITKPKTVEDVVTRQKLFKQSLDSIGHRKPKKSQTESKLMKAIKEMVKSDTITMRNRNKKQIGSDIFDSDLEKENELRIEGKQFHKFDRKCNALVTDNVCIPFSFESETENEQIDSNDPNRMQDTARTRTLCFCFCSYAKGTDGITYHTLCRCCGPTTNFST